MGAFDKLFGKFKFNKLMGGYFQMLDGYSPVFTTFDGGVYEMELTRACIHTFANHCSKLAPVVSGPDKAQIKHILDTKPNPFMTTAQFLYKLATIYDTQNTAFIVPLLDQFDRIIGYYPAMPSMTEVREYEGEPYLVYTFGNGRKLSVELYRVGIVSKFLYRSDLFGEDNSALDPTMKLLDTQNQGITEGIKTSAAFRFMAQVANFATKKDLAEERKKFTESALGPDSGGIALFPNTYSNIQQIKSNAQVVDPDQMKLIQDRAFIYFGSNEKILLNQATGDEWSAYYEGRIEPFSLQVSLAMTAMTYTANQRTRGNSIEWTSNRMQYMTDKSKLEVGSQMFDRGIFSINDVMDIWHMPHVPDGDKRYIRKEYIEISQLSEVETLKALLAEEKAKNAASAQPTDPEPTEEKEEPNDPE